MLLKNPTLILLTVGLTGCAFNRLPIVDMAGVDAAAYQGDLQECAAYADQVQVAAQAGSGAAAGAVVGAAVGAVIGNSSTAARGAGVGAVSGATSGSGRALAERRQVVRNCLLGRGYRVLN
jgi:outer membrane lipoprotein SlyB